MNQPGARPFELLRQLLKSADSDDADAVDADAAAAEIHGITVAHTAAGSNRTDVGLEFEMPGLAAFAISDGKAFEIAEASER
jgi:hypothetical protein